MLNPEEKISEIKKYLRKLKNMLETQISFSMGAINLIDKKAMDDILCCVEASFPDNYKAYIKKNGSNKLESNKYWVQILKAIKNKFLLSANVYNVRKRQAIALITKMECTLNSDIKRLNDDSSNMF